MQAVFAVDYMLPSVSGERQKLKKNTKYKASKFLHLFDDHHGYMFEFWGTPFSGEVLLFNILSSLRSPS